MNVTNLLLDTLLLILFIIPFLSPTKKMIKKFNITDKTLFTIEFCQYIALFVVLLIILIFKY